MTQGWTALAVASILALISPSASAQGGRPRVTVNETPVSFSVPPLVEHGVLMAPLDAIASAFGASVAWDGDSREGTVTSSAGIAVRLAMGEAVALVGGARVTLPAAPARRAGTVLVPAAAVLRALGAYVRTGEGAESVDALSQVTGVTWHRASDTLVVRIAATGPVRTQAHELTAPNRVAIDIMHSVGAMKESRVEVGGPDVVAIRAAQFSVRPYVTRIVLDLIHRVPFTVALDAEGIAVTLSRATPINASPPGPPTPHAPVGPPPLPPVGEPPGDRPQGAGAETELEHSNGSATSEPLAPPSLPEFVDAPGAFHVRAVRYEIEEGMGRLTILASQPVTPVVRQFAYPDRLSIDLPGGVFLPRREDLEVGSEAVRNIVVAQMQVQPNLTRVLVYLRHKTAYATASADGGRGVTFALGDAPWAAKRPPAVIIDPGHGGTDSGAVGPTGLRESDVTLGIGRLMQQAFERQGVRAVLTRSDDGAVALEDRPDIARREGGIVFISIHANASQSSGKKGTETYYGTRESQALATVVQSEVVQALGEPDRGVRPADFYVIVNAPVPAVLIETAFISNPGEERLLRDPAVQQRIADAIARAVVRFLAARSAAPAP